MVTIKWLVRKNIRKYVKIYELEGKKHKKKLFGNQKIRQIPIKLKQDKIQRS